MSTQVSHSISERAYHIWERMGRPEGQALEHWLRAEAELAKEPARRMAEADMPATPSRRGRRKKA